MDTIYMAIVVVGGDATDTSPAISTIDQSTYFSADNTTENIHPCAHTFKIQTHKSDTPTYTDIM